MFKDPPDGRIAEAWRILLAATKDKLLLPPWAQQYRDKHVARFEDGRPISDSNPGAPAIGPPLAKSARSASPPAAPAVKPPGPFPGYSCCWRQGSPKSSAEERALRVRRTEGPDDMCIAPRLDGALVH